MQKKLAVFLLLLSSYGFAKSSNLGLLSIDIEPIIGYAYDQKLVPYRHTKQNVVYGARVLLGLPLISAEAEYTKTTDTENFPDVPVSTKDLTDKLKIGLRSTFRLMGVVYAFARAGGQAKKNHHEETRNGVTTSWDDPIYVKPYVGAGLRVRMTRHLFADADFTAVFPDTKDFRYVETQVSAGFGVRFP